MGSMARWQRNFCVALIDVMLSDPVCISFSNLVLELWSASNLPNYRRVIQRPMDLGTIKAMLQSDEFGGRPSDGLSSFDVDRFVEHVRLILDNCIEFNQPESGMGLLSRRTMTT